MSADGRWEGKLADITGVTAALTLDLKGQRGKLSGDFSVAFLPPTDEGCVSPDRRLAQTGQVAGTYDEGAGSVVLRYELTIGLEPVAVTLEATMMDADPHAGTALRGCYEIENGRGALTLDGGGCVLWRYGRAPRERRPRGGR